MKHISLLSIACVGLFLGCAASIPPTELVNARQAYQHAKAGQAALLVPAELKKAQAALAIAEQSFRDDPRSFRTRDLAYVADRKAKVAEALASTVARNTTTAKANRDYRVTQAEIANIAVENLAASERKGVRKEEQRTAGQNPGPGSPNEVAKTQAELAKLAPVKEEPRGLVITLPDSTLFGPDKSVLLAASHDQLNRVAAVLMASRERMLTIEGHADSRGSSGYSKELSQRRADAVRLYIISRGYPGNRIHAHGIGDVRPIPENAGTEGRAANRRIEIIIAHAAKY